MKVHHAPLQSPRGSTPRYVEHRPSERPPNLTAPGAARAVSCAHRPDHLPPGLIAEPSLQGGLRCPAQNAIGNTNLKRLGWGCSGRRRARQATGDEGHRGLRDGYSQLCAVPRPHSGVGIQEPTGQHAGRAPPIPDRAPRTLYWIRTHAAPLAQLGCCHM